jgi:hypothetical protein
MRTTTAIVGLLLFLSTFSELLATDRPLLDIDPAVDGSLVEPANNKTWGYSFYVTSPITVTHLGWNDTGRDGLSHSHPVGLWMDSYNTNGGTLLTSVTIPAGTTAELTGPWRRVAISPIELQVGHFYSIGGQNNSQSLDNMVYKGILDAFHVPGLDPRVRPESFTFNVDGQDGFYAPGTHGSSWYALVGVELGAMLFVESVPEPSSFLLLVIAGTALQIARRHRC